jgi:hypothetical protein
MHQRPAALQVLPPRELQMPKAFELVDDASGDIVPNPSVHLSGAATIICMRLLASSFAGLLYISVLVSHCCSCYRARPSAHPPELPLHGGRLDQVPARSFYYYNSA